MQTQRKKGSSQRWFFFPQVIACVVLRCFIRDLKCFMQGQGCIDLIMLFITGFLFFFLLSFDFHLDQLLSSNK